MIVNLKTGYAHVEIYICDREGAVPTLSLSGMETVQPAPLSTASSIAPKVAIAAVVALACGLVGYNLAPSGEAQVAGRRSVSPSYAAIPRASTIPEYIPQAVPQLIPQAPMQREATAVLREMGQPPVVTPLPVGPAPASGPSAHAFGLE